MAELFEDLTESNLASYNITRKIFTIIVSV